MLANLENSTVATGLEKASFHSNPKVMPKTAQTTTQLLSHASKEMLKILQARIQQYVNCELPDVQDGFRKGREGLTDKLPASVGSSRKQESSNKIFCLIDYAKDFDCVDHNKLWKILKRWEYQATLPAS